MDREAVTAGIENAFSHAGSILADAASIWRQSALDAQRPCVIFRPRVFLDGDKWCALFGEDIQEGVCGFGDTPDAACREFDRIWIWGRRKSAKDKP